MCGLVGVAGIIGNKEVALFNKLLQIDTVRGPHSTGITKVDAFNVVEVKKELGTPWDMEYTLWKSNTDNLQKWVATSPKVLLGHNRWATFGEVNRDNAHPFTHNHIIGAHNGTLTTTHTLKDNHQFEVDSDNLYHHMSHKGVDDTVESLIGAFALTWIDKDDKTLNFVRNEQRSLYYTYINKGKTLVWASTDWIIEGAMEAAKVTLTSDIVSLPVGQHMKWDYSWKGDIGKPRVRQLELYKPKAILYKKKVNKFKDVEVRFSLEKSNHNLIDGLTDKGEAIRIWRNHPNSELFDELCAYTGDGTMFTGLSVGFYSDVHTIRILTVNKEEVEELKVDGKVVDEKVWKEATKHGCCYCTADAELFKPSELFWLDEQSFACPSCYEEHDSF